jgi:hypothetical protein
MRNGQALPGRLILLGSAYAPVALIVGSRLLPHKGGCIVLGVGALGVGIWIAFLYWLAHSQPYEVELNDFESIDTQVTGYIASLLLPVVAVASPSAGDIVAYAICAALILIVAFAADLGAANPIVYLAGLRVGRATLEGRRMIVLFRDAPTGDEPIFASAAAGVILLDKETEQTDSAREDSNG